MEIRKKLIETKKLEMFDLETCYVQDVVHDRT